MSADVTCAPLAGVRVLDLSRLLPGPYCSLVLAELGADVIKVEDTGLGDYLRFLPPLVEPSASEDAAALGAIFTALNRGKRSVSIDLKRGEGRDAFLRLVEGADVVLETFRPGVLDRLGVGLEMLQSRRPSILLCSISGYGQDGPYRDRAGHDLNYVALTGLLEHNAGGPGQAPHPLSVQLADIAGGGLFGAITILAGLVRRAATGGGGHLDVSMTDGSLACLLPGLAQVAATGAQLVRGGELLTGASHTYQVYATADGKYLSVGALEPKFWGKLCEAVGVPGLAELAMAEGEERDRARRELSDVLRTRTRDEWVEALAGLDVCAEPVLEVAEVLRHPLHEARRSFASLTFGGTELPVVRTPAARLSPAGIATSAPPRQGEHTREVLGEAGFVAEEIEALLVSGCVRGR